MPELRTGGVFFKVILRQNKARRHGWMREFALIIKYRLVFLRCGAQIQCRSALNFKFVINTLKLFQLFYLLN